jgi:hypothetical protein
MFPGFLTEQVKIIKLQDHTTAGTSAVTSDAVDMGQNGGFDSVVFLTSFGTAAANNTLKAQQSDDDGSADAYSDLAGTSVTSGSSDEDVFIDIRNVGKRYVKCVSARGTSTTQESVWAILYNAKQLPVDNTTSGTIAGEQHGAPAEGTA